MSDRRGLVDYEPGRRGVSVAGLSDGESLTVQGIGNVYLDETEHSDDAIHVPCHIAEAPDDFRDMSGEPVQTVDDTEEPVEYNIINSSSAFYNALIDVFGEAGETNGETFVITAYQPGDSFTRYYEIDR